MDLSLRLLILALEAWLLVRWARIGHTALYPWFALYLALMLPTTLLWSGAALWRHGAFWAALGTASLWMQAVIAPAKFAVVWEAFSMRAFYLWPATGREMRLVACGSAFVALAFLIVALMIEPQKNAPELLSRMQLWSQVAGAAFLACVWLYWLLRPAPEPPRARAHLTLAMLWFALFAAAHAVPVHPKTAEASRLMAAGVTIEQVAFLPSCPSEHTCIAEGSRGDVMRELRETRARWEMVNYGASVAACGILGGWLWVFRRRQNYNV